MTEQTKEERRIEDANILLDHALEQGIPVDSKTIRVIRSAKNEGKTKLKEGE